MPEKTTELFPAPWQLDGLGYTFLFKAKPEWLMENGFIPEDMKSRYIPSIGAAMLVHYQNSSAGPYDELLFIPGKFQFKHGPRFMITKIYVSSMESVINGQKNWGIPKEIADFDIQDISSQEKQFRVSRQQELIVDCQLKHGIIPFPINTAWAPEKFKSVVQYWEDEWIQTIPEAKGMARFASLVRGEFNSSLFPDLNQVRIYGGINTKTFNMTFPIPTRFVDL